MPISNAPSQVATNALKACIEAQATAAKTTWDFIQEVGLNTNPDTGEKSAVTTVLTSDIERNETEADKKTFWATP